MRGEVLNTTAPRPHQCCTPLRFPWRRLGIGARWRCECGQVWEVQRRFQFIAQAGNEVYRTGWYASTEPETETP